MIPGAPNPLMWGQGDPLDELGVIARSVRHRRSAGAYWSRVVSTAPTDVNKGTVSVWVKRGLLLATQRIFSSDILSSYYTDFGFTSGDQLYTNDGVASTVTFSPIRRDPNAWAHLVLQIDLTQTGLLKFRAYVDGVEQSSSGTAPTINRWLNSGGTHRIGCDYALGTSLDGCLAHFCAVDGYVVPPSAFGTKHPITAQWRPKSKSAVRAAVSAASPGGVRNGWGANGFFLPFDDISSLTNLGYDRSQSDTDTTGNNWTATNISLTVGSTYDSMVDTPTNNFATLNPLDKVAGTGALSDGNLTFTYSSTGTVCRATQSAKAGQLWAEMKVAAVGTNVNFGLFGSGVDLASTAASIYYRSDGQKVVNGVASAYGATYTTGDVIAAAPNYDAGTVTFYKQTGGAGAFVSQGTISYSLSAGYAFAVYNAAGSVVNLNFGQQGFGYVAQHGALPAEFKAQCTKNLPIKPPVMKSSNAFVARIDTGANILATLAAAESWANYVRIVKRRDSGEGWRWMFSDDAGNYLDSSNTAGKAAVPSFTGSSYVGYSLKVSALSGVATGRLTHVNGVADTVTDGLGSSRKAVFLKNESTGSWYFYHPDLTAGKLLYLEQTAGETTDATLSSISANSFVVAAALASGTYRWLAIVEIPGLIRISKFVGNGLADGAFAFADMPQMMLIKGTSSATNSLMIDAVRNPNNPGTLGSQPNGANSEAADSVSGLSFDLVSNGLKCRGTRGDLNGTGIVFPFISFSAFTFRYANAR